MAISFVKKDKKRTIFVLIVILVSIVISFVFWQLFFRIFDLTSFEEINIPSENVEINFEVLEKVQELQPFFLVEPYTEEVGREAPFTPY